VTTAPVERSTVVDHVAPRLTFREANESVIRGATPLGMRVAEPHRLRWFAAHRIHNMAHHCRILISTNISRTALKRDGFADWWIADP